MLFLVNKTTIKGHTKSISNRCFENNPRNKVQNLRKLNMSDISGISDEVFYSSLSKRMDREIHESDECGTLARYGELNKHGRIVVVYIRICRCGKYRNKEDVFEAEEPLILPQDGLDVHKDEQCEYVSEKQFDSSLRKHIYRFILTCQCASKKGKKRYLDYN